MTLHQLPFDILIQIANWLDTPDCLKLRSCHRHLADSLADVCFSALHLTAKDFKGGSSRVGRLVAKKDIIAAALAIKTVEITFDAQAPVEYMVEKLFTRTSRLSELILKSQRGNVKAISELVRIARRHLQSQYLSIQVIVQDLQQCEDLDLLEKTNIESLQLRWTRSEVSLGTNHEDFTTRMAKILVSSSLKELNLDVPLNGENIIVDTLAAMTVDNVSSLQSLKLMARVSWMGTHSLKPPINTTSLRNLHSLRLDQYTSGEIPGFFPELFPSLLAAGIHLQTLGVAFFAAEVLSYLADVRVSRSLTYLYIQGFCSSLGTYGLEFYNDILPYLTKLRTLCVRTKDTDTIDPLPWSVTQSLKPLVLPNLRTASLYAHWEIPGFDYVHDNNGATPPTLAFATLMEIISPCQRLSFLNLTVNIKAFDRRDRDFLAASFHKEARQWKGSKGTFQPGTVMTLTVYAYVPVAYNSEWVWDYFWSSDGKWIPRREEQSSDRAVIVEKAG